MCRSWQVPGQHPQPPSPAIVLCTTNASYTWGSVHELDVAICAQSPRLRFEQFLERSLHFRMRIERDLHVARACAPRSIGQARRIGLEHLHEARLVQERVEEACLPGKPKVRRRPVEPAPFGQPARDRCTRRTHRQVEFTTMCPGRWMKSCARSASMAARAFCACRASYAAAKPGSRRRTRALRTRNAMV